MTFLPPKDIKALYPLSASGRLFIEESRQHIKNILKGKDKRIAIVTGPCSIHHYDAAILYAEKLKKLSDYVKDSCLLIMRVYLEKPRSISGWKGFLYDPDLDESHAIDKGISLSRQLLLKLIDLGIPAATEFLSPIATAYIDDLISWGFIGERTASSQIHRELASHLSLPIGFKNTVDGTVEQAIHGIHAARIPHVFLHMNEEGKVAIVESEGNPYTHLVLRGGKESGNYDPVSIAQALESLKSAGLSSRILIDCSHGNSQKSPQKQKSVFLSVLNQIRKGNSDIMGMMLESHLFQGHQVLSENPSSLAVGVSITDPCIGWSETEELVLLACELMSSKVMR